MKKILTMSLILIVLLTSCKSKSNEDMKAYCKKYYEKHKIDLCKGDFRYKFGKNKKIFQSKWEIYSALL